MLTILKAIESELEKLHRPVVGLLAPGLTEFEIVHQLKALNLSPRDDVKILYEWHDGTSEGAESTLGDMYLFPGFYLMSLEELVDTYKQFHPDRRWQKSWAPIFANGGGDFYAVDIGSTDGRSSPVVYCTFDGDPAVAFNSLQSMMSVILECLATGVFFVSDGVFDADFVKYGVVAKKHSPGIDLWNHWS